MIDQAAAWLSRDISLWQLWGVWDFPGELDDDRLRRAVVCLADRVPVLRCRLKIGFFKARWVDNPALGPGDVVTCRKVRDREEADRETDAAVASFVDVHAGSACHVHLFEWPGRARLIFQVHHCIGDGHAVVRLMEELASCYRHVGGGLNWRPPALPCERGLGQVYAKVPFRQWLRMPVVFFLEQVVHGMFLRRHVRLHMDRDPEFSREFGVGSFRALELDPPTVSRLRDWCRQHGVTLNDYLMTCGIVAIKDWNQRRGGTVKKGRIPLVFASDLRRRYGVTTGDFANLSVVHPVSIRARDVSTVLRTLPLVKKRIDGIKRWGMGLDPLFGLLPSYLFPPGPRRAVFYPLTKIMAFYCRRVQGLTNIGILPDGVGDFGLGLRAERCSIIPPVMPVGAILFGVTTYLGRLTIHMTWETRGMSDEAAGEFLDVLRETLLEPLD
jgi:NRPS condensation-like uncharacterized protein